MKEKMDKWEIDASIRRFEDIEWHGKRKMNKTTLRNMMSEYKQTLDGTTKDIFICNLLDAIYDVYCSYKYEVDIVEVFKKTMEGEGWLIEDADEILLTTISEYIEIYEVFPTSITPVYLECDFKKFNTTLLKEIKEIERSYADWDTLAYFLIKEPCTWLAVNDEGNDFIKKIYGNKEVDAVLDGIEFVNKIIEYKDIIRDFFQNKITEEESLRKLALNDFEEIKCLDAVVALDYDTIKDLIYVDEGEFRKYDFILNCKEIIIECMGEREETEIEMDLER